MEEQQPGQIIAPGAVTSLDVSAPAEQAPAQVDQTLTMPVSQPASSQPIATQSESIPEQAPSLAANPPVLQAEPDQNYAPVEQADSDSHALTWTAAEYVHHQKDSTWYGAFTLGAIVLTVLIYLATKDIISTAVVAAAVFGLVFVSSKKPRQETYALQDDYVQIGAKAYSLHDFKAFSIDEESPVLSVTLLPLKRLMPAITIYVDESHEQAVVEYFGDFLPMEPHKVDAIDSMLRRLRF